MRLTLLDRIALSDNLEYSLFGRLLQLSSDDKFVENLV